MAGPTQVSIINLALLHIGQTAIQSTTESTVQAQAAMRAWDFALKETLAGYNWGFAKVVAALALVATYDPVSYEYAYAYPSNCAALWRVYTEETTNRDIGEKFEVMFDPTNNQDVIATDCEDAYGEYTYILTDTTKYSPYFVTALSHRLAAELAMPLNGDAEMAKNQMAIFLNLIKDAQRISSHENNEENTCNQKSEIVDSRG